MAKQERRSGGNERIRVHFHITDFNNGGIESSLLQWLCILDRDLFRVSLSVTYASPALERRFRTQIPSDVPIEVLADRPWLHYFQTRRHQDRLGKPGRVARDVHAALVVRPHLAKRIKAIASRVDVIVDYDMSLRRLCGQFNVAWLGIHHFSFRARLSGRANRVRRLLRQYGGYDCLGALNEQMADEARQMFGSQLRDVAVLPNAIDVEALRERAAAGSAEPARGCPYIVSIARLDELQKDHRTLLRAYAAMVRQHAVEEHLVIVGDGAHRNELEALACELEIAERVHFTGQLDNPHPVMAGASMLVLSSKNEGMPMVLIEALALGKVVVATDCPTGPRAILNHGKAGVLVPVGDVDAMAAAMARLLNDRPLSEEYADKALARAAFYGVTESNRRLYQCVDDIRAARRKFAA